MRIQIDTEVQDFKGEPVIEPDKTTLTYRNLFFTLLNTFAPNEVPPVEEKQRIFTICSRMADKKNTTLELSIEEAALIKDRAGKIASPLMYGRICELLEKSAASEKPQTS